MGPEPPGNRQPEPSGEPSGFADADASAARPKPTRANDTAIRLIDAYTEASGHPLPASSGAAINVAKNLVKNGVTPEDIAGCTRWLMGDPFWQSKGFDWRTVVKNIDKWRGQQARGGTQKPQTIYERFGPHVDPVLASQIRTPVRLDSIRSQTETNGGQE